MLRRNTRSFCAAATAAAAIRQRKEPSLTPQQIRKHLEHTPPVTMSKLPNGFRVACEELPNTEFCTIGVWIDAGSRFETRRNNGVAHFLEHMNFKGTKNYTKPQIETVFEHIGGHFNAYTSRDRTAYYIKVFNKHVDDVMAVLADILRYSNYPVQDLEWERSTILAEMREVESHVDEVIMDNLHLSAYDAATSGLPLTILGPADNISKHIDRDMILEYINTHYTGPRMSLVCSGGLSHNRLESIAKKHFGDVSSVNNRPQLESKYVAGDSILWNTTMMTANLAWAFPICAASHPDYIALQILHTLIGGYRREQHDLFEHLPHAFNAKLGRIPEMETTQAFFTPYEETGLFGFYYVTVPTPEQQKTIPQVLESNMEELHRLAAVEISPDVLETVKMHYKAAQLMLLDTTTNSAEDIGRQIIHLGERVPLTTMFERVDAVTTQDVKRVANKYFVNVRPVLSGVGSPATLTNYDAVKRIAMLNKQYQ